MNQIRKENKMKEDKKENIIDEDINIGRFFELATSNKVYFNALNLHEIKKMEVLEGYTGDLELIGSILVGELEQKTNSRFKFIDDFESYVSAIDNTGYDSEDVIFTGWLYILNTLEFKRVNRSQYGRGTGFKQDIVEYIGNICYTSTSGNCFIKFNNHLTGKD